MLARFCMQNRSFIVRIIVHCTEHRRAQKHESSLYYLEILQTRKHTERLNVCVVGMLLKGRSSFKAMRSSKGKSFAIWIKIVNKRHRSKTIRANLVGNAIKWIFMIQRWTASISMSRTGNDVAKCFAIDMPHLMGWKGHLPHSMWTGVIATGSVILCIGTSRRMNCHLEPLAKAKQKRVFIFF